MDRVFVHPMTPLVLGLFSAGLILATGYFVSLDGLEGRVGGWLAGIVERNRTGYPYLAAVVALCGVGGSIAAHRLLSRRPEED